MFEKCSEEKKKMHCNIRRIRLSVLFISLSLTYERTLLKQNKHILSKDIRLAYNICKNKKVITFTHLQISTGTQRIEYIIYVVSNKYNI